MKNFISKLVKEIKDNVIIYRAVCDNIMSSSINRSITVKVLDIISFLYMILVLAFVEPTGFWTNILVCIAWTQVTYIILMIPVLGFKRYMRLIKYEFFS